MKNDKTEYKVGTLSAKIANAINRKPGAIVITQEALAHIQYEHNIELGKLGFTAESYVSVIVNNFNEVYEDTKRKSLLLVYKPSPDKNHGAAITIAIKDGKYFVKSAFPMKVGYLRGKTMLLQK